MSVPHIRSAKSSWFTILVESQARCRLVEDLVRDVAMRLNDEPRVLAYVAEAENFESIHNHSAYALIEHDKEKPADKPTAVR